MPAGRPGAVCDAGARKEGARGGTTGYPTLNFDIPEEVLEAVAS
jgi:hypothetical protein